MPIACGERSSATTVARSTATSTTPHPLPCPVCLPRLLTMSHLTHRDYNDSGQRKSRALLSVLQAENGDESVDVLVDKIVEIAEEVLDSERVLLLFVDRAQQELYTLNCPVALSLPLDRGIAGYVARTGTIVRADAATHSEWDVTVDHALGLRIQSCLCIPILNVAGGAYAVLLALNKRMSRDAAPEPTDDETAADDVIPFTEEDQDIGNYLCQGAGYTLRRRLTEVIMIRSRGRPGEGIDRETQSMLDMYGNTRPANTSYNAGYNASYERQMDRTVHGKRRSLGTTAFPPSVLHSIMHAPSIPEQHHLQASLSDGSAFLGREAAGSSGTSSAGSAVSAAVVAASKGLNGGKGSRKFLGDSRRATWSRTMSTPFKGRHIPPAAKFDMSQTTDFSAVKVQQPLGVVHARRSSSGGGVGRSADEEEQLSAEADLDGSARNDDGGSNGLQTSSSKQFASGERSNRGGSLYGVQGTAWLSPRGQGRKTLIASSQPAATYNYTQPLSKRPPTSSPTVSSPPVSVVQSQAAPVLAPYHPLLNRQSSQEGGSLHPTPVLSSTAAAHSSSSSSSSTTTSPNMLPSSASRSPHMDPASSTGSSDPSGSSLSSSSHSSSTSGSRLTSPAISRVPSISLSGSVPAASSPKPAVALSLLSSAAPSTSPSPLLSVPLTAPTPPRMSLSALTLLSPAPWAAVTIERVDDSNVSSFDSDSEASSAPSSTLSIHPRAYSFYSSTASFASLNSADMSRSSSSSTSSTASTASSSTSTTATAARSSSSSSSTSATSSLSNHHSGDGSSSVVSLPLSAHLISTPTPATFASVSVSLPWPLLPSLPLSDMGELATLNFNVFDYDDDQLLHCCFHMLDSLDLVNAFSLSLDTLQCFLLGVRSKYRSNPYHNFYHAVSVMQFAYFSVCKTELHEALPKLDQLALLVGCLCHDIDHPGTNNAFQVLAASELALLHNDQAVLENHHAATTFALLCCPDMSIFSPLHSSLTTDDVRAIRKMMISSILSTDMARHFDMCLTGDHRVMTRTGWRSITRMAVGDEVLSFNIDSWAMEWKSVCAITSHHVDPRQAEDTLYRMQGSGMDIIATRDHRMLLARLKPGTNSLQVQNPILYETVGDLLNLTYNATQPTVGPFTQAQERAVLCAGRNTQPAVKVVIPGLERVCEWWWNKDGQLSFLHFLGLWLVDGCLDSTNSLVCIGEQKVELYAGFVQLLDAVFPRCWYRHKQAQVASFTSPYAISCPPLYNYLLLMAVGPIGYNPLDAVQLRSYPHFTADDELAEKEQQSAYCKTSDSSGYVTRWTEDAMLAAFTASASPPSLTRSLHSASLTPSSVNRSFSSASTASSVELDANNERMKQEADGGEDEEWLTDYAAEAQAMQASGAIVWRSSGQWSIIDGHWFSHKRWLGEQNVASVFSQLSRAQATALLEGCCRADGGWSTIQHDGSGEATGEWTCSSSSFPLIDHLQLIGQLAGAAVDLQLTTKPGQSHTTNCRTAASCTRQWMVRFTFTRSEQTSFQHTPLAQPVDVSVDVDGRGYYQYADDGKVWCITVDGNSNFLTQRLSHQRLTNGSSGVRAQSVFVGNCHELDMQQPECADIEWDKEQHRQFILNLITHSADLSGQITPLHIAKQWEERIAREFMQQSSMELHYGLPLTAYLQDMHIERVRLKNHLNFLNFVMTPLWTGLVEMFPNLRECAENLVNNRKYFMDRVRDEDAKSGELGDGGSGDANCNGGAAHHPFSVNLRTGDEMDDEYGDVSEEPEHVFHVADSNDAASEDNTVVTIHDSRSRCTSLDDDGASELIHTRAANNGTESGSVMFAIDEDEPQHHRFGSSSDSAVASPHSDLSSRNSVASTPSRSPSASLLSSPLTSGRNSLLHSANISSRGSPHFQPNSSMPFVPLSISINGVAEEVSAVSVPVSPHSTSSVSVDGVAVRKHESIKDRRESRWGDQLINIAPQPPATLSPASSTASLSPVTPPPPPLLLSPLPKDGRRQQKQSIGERRVSVIQSLQQANTDRATAHTAADGHTS